MSLITNPEITGEKCCVFCNGKGFIPIDEHNSKMILMGKLDCPDCNGDGHVLIPEHPLSARKPCPCSKLVVFPNFGERINISRIAVKTREHKINSLEDLSENYMTIKWITQDKYIENGIFLGIRIVYNGFMQNFRKIDGYYGIVEEGTRFVSQRSIRVGLIAPDHVRNPVYFDLTSMTIPGVNIEDRKENYEFY